MSASRWSDAEVLRRLALELLDQALSWGLRKKPALVDSGYGEVTEFRDALVERGLRH